MEAKLLHRANIWLVRLKLLSDAKTSGNISALGHQQKATASPPPETRLDSNGGPPPKDRSLYEWYLWHFERADNAHRWRALCYLAERDYEKAHRRPSDARRAPISLRGRDGAEMEREAAERVIEWYPGLEVMEVAILEECSEAAVRKARRMMRRDEDTGREYEGWRGWSDEARHDEVVSLKKEGLTQRAIADKLAISERTVRRYNKKATK